MMPERLEGSRGPVLTSQLIFGIVVIVAGALLTLDNLDIVDASRYLPFWPIVLLSIGLVNLLSAKEPPQRVFGGFLTFIGAVLLMGRWGFLYVRIWDLWPLLLIFWGAMIVWRGWHGPSSEPAAANDPSNVVSVVAFLSGFDRIITGDGFRGGEISAFMGGGKLDLTRARMPAGTTAVVQVSALMGGVEIRIPEDWAVDNRVTYFMGGSNNRSRLSNSSNPPRLVLKGFVMMGGVEVRN
jgi:predicted membrane protein